MLGFAYTTVRFLGALWSNTWRRVFRSKKSVAVTAAVAVLAGCVWIGATSARQPGPATAGTDQTKATPKDDGWTTVTAEPLDQETQPGESSIAGTSQEESERVRPTLGANQQAKDPEGTKPSYEPQAVPPPPKKLNVDNSDPKSVATAWAKAYLSRGEDSQQWQQRIEPLTVDDLHDHLTSQEAEDQLPIADKTPTHVAGVQLQDAAKQEPADTPVRWSRQLVIAVEAAKGSTTNVTYSVSLSRSGDGWKLTDAVQESWNAQPTDS
ncbi:hypothetical protein [Arthrobacter pigmenti]